jgi:uncharacterized phage protein gp47/JayE
MTSPDWSEYVDLTVFDKTTKDIFDESIDYGIDVLPEWSPQAGQIEVVLLEAIANQAANVDAAANRVPGAVTETLMLLYGIERDEGVAATASLDVTMINTTGYVIPAGANFSYFPPNSGTALVYTLDEDINVASGGSTGSGIVSAIEVGVAHNTPSVGSSLQILMTMPYLSTSVFGTAPEGGTDPESNDAYLDRASTTLRSYSAALTTPTQIQAWVLVTYPNIVYRANVYDRRRKNDRDTTSPTYDLHDGFALVVVAGLNATIVDTSDVPVSVEDRQTIEEALDLKTNTGLVTELVNVELVDITVNVTVMPFVGYTTSQIQTSVDDALNLYLSPNEWDWADTVRENELLALIDNVVGVNYVASLNSVTTTSGEATVSGNDVAFHQLGSMPVSTANVITVLSP